MPKYKSRKWVNGKWKYEYEQYMPTKDSNRLSRQYDETHSVKVFKSPKKGDEAVYDHTEKTYTRNTDKLLSSTRKEYHPTTRTEVKYEDVGKIERAADRFKQTAPDSIKRTTRKAERAGKDLASRAGKAIANTDAGKAVKNKVNEIKSTSAYKKYDSMTDKASDKMLDAEKKIKTKVNKKTIKGVTEKASSKGKEFLRKRQMKKEQETNGVSTYNNIGVQSTSKPKKVYPAYKDANGKIHQNVSYNVNAKGKVRTADTGKDYSGKTILNVSDGTNKLYRQNKDSSIAAKNRKEAHARNRAGNSTKSASQIRREREQRARRKSY